MNDAELMRRAAPLMDMLAPDTSDGERYADLYDELIALIEDTLKTMSVPGHAWAGEAYPASGRLVCCSCGRAFNTWVTFVEHVEKEGTR